MITCMLHVRYIKNRAAMKENHYVLLVQKIGELKQKQAHGIIVARMYLENLKEVAICISVQKCRFTDVYQ